MGVMVVGLTKISKDGGEGLIETDDGFQERKLNNTRKYKR